MGRPRKPTTPNCIFAENRERCWRASYQPRRVYLPNGGYVPIDLCKEHYLAMDGLLEGPSGSRRTLVLVPRMELERLRGVPCQADLKVGGTDC